MASGLITSWQIDLEPVADFIFLGSKITADGDCSHEIKRCLLLGRKVMTNLDSILKNRDFALPTNVCLVKAMVFPVVMYGCECWTIKKAERRRIDAFFELWCWRRLLRVPWTSRRSQSILKEISPGYSLDGGGSGNLLQYSCLENPLDRGAWWAAVYGVTQSWTRLKQLSSSSSSSSLEGLMLKMKLQYLAT